MGEKGLFFYPINSFGISGWGNSYPLNPIPYPLIRKEFKNVQYDY